MLFLILTVLIGLSASESINSMQPHIAFTGDLTERRIMWYSESDPHGKNQTEVVWWSDPSEKHSAKSYSTRNYTMVDLNGNKWPSGWHHVAVMGNLEPNTMYSYYVNNGTATSPTYFLKTRETDNTKIHDFTMAIYGDHGLGRPPWVGISTFVNDRILDLTANFSLDAIWHVGDIAYPNAHTYSQYEGVYNAWFEKLAPAFASTPLMVAVGNHESYLPKMGDDDDMDRFAKEHCSCTLISASEGSPPVCANPEDVEDLSMQHWNFTAYDTKFSMPTTGVANMWYSVDYASVHFAIIDTETDFYKAWEHDLNGWGGGTSDPQPHQSLQYKWLDEDLKKADANPDIKYIIVMGHRPMYSHASTYEENGIPRGTSKWVLKEFEPLFKRYGVDMYFAGHQHGYERTGYVYNATVAADGEATMHVLSGAPGGGCGITASWDPDTPDWIAASWPNFQPSTEEEQEEVVGFGLLRLENEGNTLRWTFYVGKDWSVHDEVVLKNKRTRHTD